MTSISLFEYLTKIMSCLPSKKLISVGIFGIILTYEFPDAEDVWFRIAVLSKLYKYVTVF